jgi:Ohr subfamily peroxiredoxin
MEDCNPQQDGNTVKPLYTAEALASGEGRDGNARTNDGKLDVTLSSPVELGGTGEGTNPEQLFAAGYAACFHSALRLVGRKERADLTDSAVAAKVHLGQLDTAGFGLAAELEIALPALDLATAEALVAKAHEICPYSNATRGNITVDLKILEYAA